MRRVEIQKVIFDRVRGIYIEGGKKYEGWEERGPVIGEPYRIFCDSGAILRTSEVIRIKDGYFETMNSCYRLTVLEEEPFDLSGEDRPKKTREIIIKRK
jgi:hypothetical protein